MLETITWNSIKIYNDCILVPIVLAFIIVQCYVNVYAFPVWYYWIMGILGMVVLINAMLWLLISTLTGVRVYYIKKLYES